MVVFPATTTSVLLKKEFSRSQKNINVFREDVAVSDNHDISSKFILNPAYPNPFNSGTTISYSLNSASFVELSIYNLKGQLVDCICKEKQNSGRYSYTWNPDSISTGIYFIKLTADNYADIKRCIYLK